MNEKLPAKEELAVMTYDEVSQQASDYDALIVEQYDAKIEPLEAEKAILEKKRRTANEGKRLKTIGREIADLERQKEEERLQAGKYFADELRRRWKNGEHSMTFEEAEQAMFLDEAEAQGASRGAVESGVSRKEGDVEPTGYGDFGPIFTQFKGDAKGAISKLIELQSGEAIAALHHKDVGDIDLVWGIEGTGHSDGMGLAKLVKYHPEVVERLQEILDDMVVVKRTDNRINLESETHKAAVRLTWNNEAKKWLLTAFEKKETPESIDKTTDTDENPTDLQGDTALLQNSGVSERKDNALLSEKQEDGEKDFLEAEEFAKAVANPETVANAQPLSLEDMRDSITEEPATTSTEAAEQLTKTETQPEADKPVNPSGNKLVTDERYAELRERMRKKLGGQLNMGVDPEILAIGTEMAVYHIEKGARKFTAYAKAMIDDLGDAIRPYLKAFYNAVRDMPEAEAAGLVADMDSYDEVRNVDIANFDKSTIDAMATATAVVAEEEAEKQKAEAERKLKEKRNERRTSQEPKYSGEVTLKDGRKAMILYVSRTGDVIPGVETEPYKVEYHGQTRDGEMITFADEDVADGSKQTEQAPISEGEKKSGRKNNSKTKSQPSIDGGLFDAIENETEVAPAITVPEHRPPVDLIGDSAEYQERAKQTVELVEDISNAIESRVALHTIRPNDAKPLTMTDVKKMASKYPALKDISDTDLQELVELAMTQLTRSDALINIDGTAEQQRAAFDRIVNLYQMQPSLNARDSERLIKQQYSTPTPFGFVMGQFVRAGGKTIDSMLEPSAGNGALTITVNPSVIHVNDIDDTRLANLRKLGYGQVTAQDALLPFAGDKVDVVMTNPPFGTITEKVYDGVFRISSLEAQMAINALEKMKDDGRAAIVIGGNTSYRTNGSMNPKDAAFFGYLYSHYNVSDVINISGKALYSRNGTGYDVRMILIDGRKTGEFQRVFPPVKAKARAEQITTFDELYKRVQYDIQQIQQMGNPSADVQRDPGTAADGTASAPVRTGSNRPVGRPDTTSDVLGGASKPHSGQPTPRNDGNRPAGVDNADGGNGTGSNDVPRRNSSKPGQREQHIGLDNGRGRSGDDGRGTTASRPDRRAERLAVKPNLTTEKVPYPNQSENGLTRKNNNQRNER